MWKKDLMFSFACVRVMCCDEYKLRASTQMESKGRGVPFCCLLSMGWSHRLKRGRGNIRDVCNAVQLLQYPWAQPCSRCAQIKSHLLWLGWAQRTLCMDRPDVAQNDPMDAAAPVLLPSAQKLISASSAPNPGMLHRCSWSATSHVSTLAFCWSVP